MGYVLCESMQNSRDSGKHRGRLLLIVGPSGSGKDTLIDWLKSRYEQDERILFVQRVITRKPDATGENHIGLSPHSFEVMKKQGRFAVSWAAHDLQYALPIEALHHVENGGIAIANGSRRALADITRIFSTVQILHLLVERKALEARLVARGRESPDQVRQRLDSAVTHAIPKGLDCVEVDNSRPVEVAGSRVEELIASMLVMADAMEKS